MWGSKSGSVCFEKTGALYQLRHGGQLLEMGPIQTAYIGYLLSRKGGVRRPSVDSAAENHDIIVKILDPLPPRGKSV